MHNAVKNGWQESKLKLIDIENTYSKGINMKQAMHRGLSVLLISLSSSAMASGTASCAATTTNSAFTQAAGLLSQVEGFMQTIGAVIITIALLYVGFKMVFHAAEWKDVSPVFWGGLIIGGASTFAAFLNFSSC